MAVDVIITMYNVHPCHYYKYKPIFLFIQLMMYMIFIIHNIHYLIN